METVAGFHVAVDLTLNDIEDYAKYAILDDGSGRAIFSGGLGEMTDRIHDGELRIDHAPEMFGVGAHFNNGGGASTVIFRQCFASPTVLLMVIKDRDKPSEDVRWLWVKSGKFAH